LRYYEKLGLLKNIQRDQNQRRIYSENDIDQLNRILHLRHIGASVEETTQILNLLDTENHSIETYDMAIEVLDQLESKTNQKIEELQQQQVFLQKKRHRFQKEKLALKSKI